VPEVDAAVSGDARRIAGAMEEAGFGRSVALSERPPRVFRVAGRRREVDLTEIEGSSIEEDLGRRDFTVNAMAFDLAGRRWVDPYRGREDLAAGRLRMIAARNLEDDPLRVLRAARFIATHGLEPDAATSRACRLAAAGLDAVALERVRTEWSKLLEAAAAGPAIAWAARAGVLAPALGIATEKARRVARTAGLFDASAIRRLAPQSRRRIRLAILCWRIGLTPAETGAWLAARRWSRAESGEAAALLRLARGARDAGKALPQWEWVRDAGPLAAEALALLSLLSPGQASRARRLRDRLRQARRRGPRVSGADVIGWLGVSPGPEVGRLLAKLEVEILRGAVCSRGQARAWLSGQAAGGPVKL